MGKGSKPRPTNMKKFQTNYCEIDWRKKCKKCGVILPENSKEDVCDKCIDKSLNEFFEDK